MEENSLQGLHHPPPDVEARRSHHHLEADVDLQSLDGLLLLEALRHESSVAVEDELQDEEGEDIEAPPNPTRPAGTSHACNLSYANLFFSVTRSKKIIVCIVVVFGTRTQWTYPYDK